MADQPKLDVDLAHKYFSANCFNNAWDYIDKKERTAAENEQMILLSLASLWHWTQRDDCDDGKKSIGYWQASRVYALAGEADNARKYGQLCLDVTPKDASFYVGYAYEALARAESVAGHADKAKQYLAEARRCAEKVEAADEKKLLVDDLDGLQ